MSAPTAAPSAASARTRAGVLAAVVLLTDQAVKGLVTAAIERGEQRDLVAGIKLVNTRNSGVAFGQLQGASTLVAIVIAAAVIALLVYFARNAGRPWIWLPTGLLLGGALGNIADRISEGAVIDFLKLPYWPAFNVADASITVGVVILVLVMERGDGARSPA